MGTVRQRLDLAPLVDIDVVKVAREAGPVFSPTFDVLETADCYGLLADLPGVRQEDLEVTWTAERIRIAGRREPEPLGEGADFYALERTFGRFARSFSLPAGACVDRTSAVLKDGVLTVLVPKPSVSAPIRVPLGVRLAGCRKVGSQEREAEAAQGTVA